VIEALGLRPDVAAVDLVGQGCGAALPNLRTADAFIASRRADRVLSICVEVCSAAFYLDNDLGVLVSACLFGDGAAAAVLTREPREGMRRVEFAGAGSIVDPSQREALRFEQRGGMLRNILTLPVPKLAARHARRLFDEVSEREAGRARRGERLDPARRRAQGHRGIAGAPRARGRGRAVEPRDAARVRQHQQPRSSSSCCARPSTRRAPGGLVVDVVVRGRIQLPRNAAAGRLMAAARVIEPEWLDELPHEDPRARRSRRDLARVNALMGNDRIVAGELARLPALASVAEIGAGDGAFMRAVLRRMDSPPRRGAPRRPATARHRHRGRLRLARRIRRPRAWMRSSRTSSCITSRQRTWNG
jgi:hypothetical protein